MKRVYEAFLAEHLRENRQMAFLCGPRQVGKTTTACSLMTGERYLSWDAPETRRVVLRGAASLASTLGVDTLSEKKPVVVLDEFHKYGKWKTFLKGFFDTYGTRCRCIVTGSARLDTYRRGGDSLMGRYFVYRMHPLSVGELVHTTVPERETRDPVSLPRSDMESLLRFGGFPEPFTRQSVRFYNRWTAHRADVLFKEDLRDLTRVHEIGLVQTLSELLAAQSGQVVNYSRLASSLTVSVDTVTRWVRLLEALYVCFTVRPWFKNVAKSLRKQPKGYLWDWSSLADQGARHENFVAGHLLKAVHAWTDMGLGRYELRYLRDKAGREVDFVVIRNGKPWFLVEVKTATKRDLNPNLAYFQRATGAAHAFQACFDLEYVGRDCFSETQPVRIPVSTLLAQLV